MTLRKLSDVGRALVLFQEDSDEAMQLAEAYRRRWRTSEILVVVVGEVRERGGKWLAKAVEPKAQSKESCV